MRRGQVVDVPRGVLDLLDLQRVHHDAELLHLAVAAILDLLGDPVPLPDDLLDGEAADDGSQVAGEHPADEQLHAVLLGQEPARRVRDRRLVVADLERGDRPDVEPDALVSDAFLDDLGLLQGEREYARLLLHRDHEAAVSGDDAELRRLVPPLRAGDQ